jgi:hypothetical protein
MHQNFTWVTCSLFCSRSHWNHLLNAIESFLNYRHNKAHIKNWLVELNYLCGENIRFAFFIPSEQCEHLALETNTWFKTFFSKANFPAGEPELPLKDIFLPFPQNTVQYGLYRPDITSSTELTSKNLLRTSLSNIMIEALKTEDIDDEVILTFTYYLHISLIKTIIKKNYASVTELYNFYNDTLPVNLEEMVYGDWTMYSPDNGEQQISAIIAENAEKLLEIADSIINPLTKEDIPGWLEQWTALCDRQMKMDLPSANTFHTKYSRIVYQLYKQLGINEKVGLMLTLFIRRTFEANILNDLHIT